MSTLHRIRYTRDKDGKPTGFDCDCGYSYRVEIDFRYDDRSSRLIDARVKQHEASSKCGK